MYTGRYGSRCIGVRHKRQRCYLRIVGSILGGTLFFDGLQNGLQKFSDVSLDTNVKVPFVFKSSYQAELILHVRIELRIRGTTTLASIAIDGRLQFHRCAELQTIAFVWIEVLHVPVLRK